MSALVWWRRTNRERWFAPFICAAAGAAVSLTVAPNYAGLLGAILAILMAVAAAVDARRFIIPDAITLPGSVLGIVNEFLVRPHAPFGVPLDALLRAAVMALIFFSLGRAYRAWRGIDGIGLGDVKLAALGGTWLDWGTLPLVVEVAALSALCAVALRAMRRSRRPRRSVRVPFGLFLAPAIWIGWLFESALVTLI